MSYEITRIGKLIIENGMASVQIDKSFVFEADGIHAMGIYVVVGDFGLVIE